MKKIKLLTIILLGSSTIIAQTTKKVCFLGNSYTYVNDMPSLIDSIANHDGNDLIKDQNTPGGHTLNQHSTNTTSLSKITSNTWDYVVLQDQSQFPSFPYSQTSVDVYPKAIILSDSIRSANACAVPLFFNTWGREIGDAQWDSINTFSKMNNRLYYAYEFMAETNSGKLSPVGIGFRHVYEDASGAITHGDLYSADGSHPSIFGSYLAACIFYNVIYETSPVANTYLPTGVTPIQATYLQDVAYHVVNDVDSVNIDYTNPIANFSSTTNQSLVSFQNTSLHAFDYSWDFGDGNSSTDEHPTHTYAQMGTFSVTLTATYCGREDQYTFDVVIGDLSLMRIENSEITIFPNPSNGKITINTIDESQAIKIYNTQGQLLNEILPNNNSLTLDLPKGMYFIKIGQNISKVIITE